MKTRKAGEISCVYIPDEYTQRAVEYFRDESKSKYKKKIFIYILIIFLGTFLSWFAIISKW